MDALSVSRPSSHNVVHPPVMVGEVLHFLALQPGLVVVDATVGGGGYLLACADALGGRGLVVGLDVEAAALARVRARLTPALKPLVHLVRGSFRDMVTLLRHLGIQGVDRVVFDLGLSWFHLLTSGRGFSFQRDEPLLMTFSEPEYHKGPVAADIVNQWSAADLASLFRRYGDEPYAERIARAIVTARRQEAIRTSSALAEVVAAAVPHSRHARGRHPARRVFQAIRMVVNDEERALVEGLEGAQAMLRPSGRIVVVGYHSGEDRIVKQTFRRWQKEGRGTILTKRPLRPTREEVHRNPAARSARLRCWEQGGSGQERKDARGTQHYPYV